MIQKVFFLQQEIVVFLPDCINVLASRQKIPLEKIRKFVNGVFRIIHRRVERSDILNSILNFWMVWQAREKTDPALGAVDGHLCPEAWWIGIWSAEIGDALLDQTGCPVQTAQ